MTDVDTKITQEDYELYPLWPAGEGDGKGFGYGYGPMEDRPYINASRVPGANIMERILQLW